MTTTQSKETQARIALAGRIGRGHLTPEEQWMVAGLVSMVGVRAELGDVDDRLQVANWELTLAEYRRLVPEGGA